MRLTVTDKLSYPITRREYTEEGFLRAPGRVARTGIQEYLAGELGLPGDQNRIVRVFRPESEVFKQESLDSYSGADITIEHPSKMVDSESYKNVSIGTISGSATKDGSFVLANLIIKDSTGIKTAERGKVQLSAGYSAIYDDNVPENADYEYIQRDIQINHVALVDRARGGVQARLFDNKTELNKVGKITLDSGKSVDVQDESAAVLVNDHIDRQSQKIESLQAEIEKSKAVNDSLKEKLDEAIKQSSDAAIKERVEKIASVKEIAKKIAGKDFTCDSTNIIEIQRAALNKKRPLFDWAEKSDTYIKHAFDIYDTESQMSNPEKDDENEDGEGKDAKKKSVDKQYKQLSKDGAAGLKVAKDARQEFINDLVKRGEVE